MRYSTLSLIVPLALAAIAPTAAHAGLPQWVKPVPQPPSPIIEDAYPALMWLHFGDITLDNCPTGTSNSGRDCSETIADPFTFPALGDAALETLITDTVKAAFAAYDITWATERPGKHIPYSMFVTASGDTMSADGNCTGGFRNCDALKRNDIRWGYAGCNDPDTMMPYTNDELASIAVRGVASMFGLEVTQAAHSPDWMADMDLTIASREWQDACNVLQEFPPEDPMDPAWQPVCDSQHHQFCDMEVGERGTEQNAHQELLAMFGAAPAMPSAAPTIDSVTPADGEMFDAGASLTITANVTDDGLRLGVGCTVTCVSDDGCGAIAKDEVVVDNCSNPEACMLEFGINHAIDEPWDCSAFDGAPGGDYRVDWIVTDYHGQSAEETVNFTIAGGGGGDDGTGSGDDGGSADGGSDDGGDGGDSGQDSDTDTDSGDSSGGSGGDDSGGGCSCSADNGSGLVGLGLFVMAGLGLRRRRTV